MFLSPSIAPFLARIPPLLFPPSDSRGCHGNGSSVMVRLLLSHDWRGDTRHTVYTPPSLHLTLPLFSSLALALPPQISHLKAHQPFNATLCFPLCVAVFALCLQPVSVENQLCTPFCSFSCIPFLVWDAYIYIYIY